ncbi:MAG: choice-of-anchor J domain-containing protein [Flavobacteriales bacterium]|nr:choice-of-anchor J domain-containing protein [Flavobacteriales bacterium]MCB9196750.1 choice-of-anchor J domain-containing protein [Flavobacteriales bacterium]
MKKLYTILGAALIAGSVSAQTVYESQDFETSLAGNGWTVQNPTANDTTVWYQSTGTNSYAKISNYYSTPQVNVPAESWLISPLLDLSLATNPVLTFQSVMKFAGDSLTLLVSTDYDGSSDPTQQGTWVNITASANWDTDDAAWGSFSTQGSGDVSLTPYISANTYIAFKYIGSATDGSTWELDNIIVNEGGGGSTGTDVSIYDIQYTTASPADSPYMGQTVNTGGIVTHVRADNKFYIASGTGPYTSVYVFDGNQTVAVGDSVTFTAEVDENYELTELKNLSNFVVVSSGNFFMSNAVTTAEANSEAYESALVQVTGECTAAANSYNEYPVNDGSGDVLTDDFFIGASNFQAPTVGDCYQIRGIVDFTFGEFKILARNSADIVHIGANCPASVEENGVAYAVYPNPTNGSITLDVVGNHTLSITDVTGKVVEVMNVGGTSNISLVDYKAGIYFFNIEGNVTKVIVK